MRKSLFVIVALAMVLTSLIPVATAPVSAAGPYNISLLTGSLDNPYWITVKNAAEKTAKDLGVNLTVLGVDVEGDSAKQVSQLEDRIAKKDAAIIIAVQDTKALIPAIEQANKAKIPVIAIDKTAEGGDIASVIMTNNIVGAGLGAQMVADKIGGKGKVLVLEGVPGGQTANDRKAGALAVLKNYPDIKVISLPGDWQTAKAQSVVEDVLTANPDLAGIFASNDMMAIGAQTALTARNLADKVTLVGYDAIPPALEMVADGRMSATVAQFPDKMGDLGVRFAVRILDGQSVPKNVDSGTLLVTKDNVLEFQLRGTPPKVAKPYNISVLTGSLDNPFWITAKEGAEKAAKDLGVTVIVLGVDVEGDAAKQVSQLEDRIAKKDAAIVIAVQDTKALIPAIEQANKAGIPVIAIDKSAEGGQLASVIMTNNIVGAGLGAQMVADKIGGKGKVLVLEGVPGGQTANDRKAGALAVLKNYPDIKVISLPGDWQTAKAQSVVEDVLTANPDLAGIFASNDMMAIGAQTALTARNLADKVTLVGYDAIPPALQMVKDGRMGATVAQFPGKMGAMGVEYAVRAIQGEKVPATVDSGTMLVTKDNVDLFSGGVYGK